MLADARRRQITERLVERGSITVSEIAAEFGVTTETIRKDIIHLESIGVARKCFGGAVIAEDFGGVLKGAGENTRSRAKTLIAARAAELVPVGANVLVDGGTTTHALGERLALRDDLTIFTNSASLLGPLSRSNSQVFVIGGRLQIPAMSNVGPWAVQVTRATNFDIAFLGTDGLHGTPGPTSSSYDESEFKATAIASSRQVVVLCDSSKFEHTGLFVFSSWRNIDLVVTDGGIAPSDRARLEEETKLIISTGGADDAPLDRSSTAER